MVWLVTDEDLPTLHERTSTADNALLAVLSPEAIEEMDVEFMLGSVGDELLPPDEPITHLFFPTTGIISVVGSTSEGNTAEIGVIGPEGAAGVVALMEALSSPLGKMMQTAGEVIRVPRGMAQREFGKAGAFQKGVLAFAQRFAIQMAQTTLCNRLHLLDERLIRWLLMRHDRLAGDDIRLTHDLLGSMIGSSPSLITHELGKLQARGYIAYSWNQITVLDRAALEAHTCECYAIIQRAYEAD